MKYKRKNKIEEIRKTVDLKSLPKKEKLGGVQTLLVAYPRFNELLEGIEGCHEFSKSTKDPECIFIDGDTGAGKSTLSREYVKRYPPTEEDDGTKIQVKMPVLLTTIPIPATIKNMVTEMLNDIGDPLAGKGTTQDRTNRLRDFLKDCGVELIIIDELQHFKSNGKVLEDVSDWLKNLLGKTEIPMVLIGLPEAKDVLNKNPQLSRRFANRQTLEPFKFKTAEQIDEFRKFLYTIDMRLPLEKRSNLASYDMASRFYYASDGVVAYIMKLVRYGTKTALERKEESLSLEILADAFDLHVKHDKPEKGNPFMKGFDFETAKDEPVVEDVTSRGSKVSEVLTTR